MTFRQVDLGMLPVHLARINYAGDLGYELWAAPEYQRALFDRIVAAGEPHGLRLFGMRALMSLRLEKSYGTWFREYRPIYTPAEGGITRYLRLDHDFIGRAAHEAELAAGGPKRRLVAFVVDPDPDDPADVIGDEPIWHGGEVVGWVTSGGYGHHVQRSIALGYVPTELSTPDGPGARASRSRSSAGVVRPGSSPSRCSTRVAGGCAMTDGRGSRRRARLGGRIVVDGRRSRSSRGYGRAGDPSGGEQPGHGGTLCLAGDCPNCLATVDGIAYVRTCQVACVPGLGVVRHPPARSRPSPSSVPRTSRDAAPARDPRRAPRRRRRGHRRRGERPAAAAAAGASGQRRPRPRRRGRRGGRGHLCRPDDRRPDAARDAPRRGREVVVATGAAEIHPVCPGNDLTGLLTARAAERRTRPASTWVAALAVGTPPDGVPCERVFGACSASSATTPVGSARS